MSTITLDTLTREIRPVPTSRTVPAVRRPRRDADRGRRPSSRPERSISTPTALAGSASSCRLAAPHVEPVAVASWRLTERGLAVVLVLFTMIALASVAVVGLTALRVTGDTYRPYGQSVVNDQASGR